MCLIMTYPPLYYAVEKVLDPLLMTWSEQTHISLPSTVFKLAAFLILSSSKTGTGEFIEGKIPYITQYLTYSDKYICLFSSDQSYRI